MFLFGKKKKEKRQEPEVEKVDYSAFIQEAEAKEKTLEGLDEAEQLPIINDIGALYFKAEAWDKAIYYYEKSLAIKREMGKPYTDLMSLYNKKRQLAAQAKNDEEVRFYLDKVQEMMQMSKDMLRGKI